MKWPPEQCSVVHQQPARQYWPGREAAHRAATEARDALPDRRPSAVSGTPSSATACAEDDPRDCVVTYPVVGSDAVMLVGYDSSGEAQIEIRMKTSRLTASWEKWILRWVRLWDRKAIRLVR